MNHKNPELCNALRTYVSEALQFLKKRNNDGESIPVILSDTWTKQGAGLFTRNYSELHLWAAFVYKAKTELMNLHSYKNLTLELAKESSITEQFDKLIGTQSSRSLFTEENIGQGMISRLLSKQEGFKFNNELFERIYASLEDFLYSTTISCGVLAPIANFSTESTPIQLEDNINIERLKDHEVVTCLKNGIFPAGSGFARTPEFAVRLKYQVRKIVQSQNGENKVAGYQEVKESNLKFEEQLDNVIHALRIFKSGECSYVTILHYTDNPWRSGGISWGPRNAAHHMFVKYSLTKDEAKSFQKFLEDFRSKEVKKRNFIEVACTRFSYANERSRPEDKLIDLMIAAEALFLSDSGDSKYRGELRYRLALRASFFISGDGKHRKEIFNHMKYAYDIRSSLVHGGKPKLPSNFDSLSDFVESTENYLRTAIHKAIDLAYRSKVENNCLADWDDLILHSE